MLSSEKQIVLNVAFAFSLCSALGAIAFRGYQFIESRPRPTVSTLTSWREVGSAGSIVGPPTAKVTLAVFSDFQCPFCKQFADSSRAILSRYPKDVRLVFRHRPISTLHTNAIAASRAAICADAESRFVTMHDLLFAKQDSIGKIGWIEMALRAGITDTLRFEACLRSEKTAAILRRDEALADRVGATATPIVLVNQTMIAGMPQGASLDSLIRAAIAR